MRKNWTRAKEIINPDPVSLKNSVRLNNYWMFTLSRYETVEHTMALAEVEANAPPEQKKNKAENCASAKQKEYSKNETESGASGEQKTCMKDDACFI